MRNASPPSDPVEPPPSTTVADLFALAESSAHLASFVWHLPNGPAEWSEQLFRLLGMDPEKDTPDVDAFFSKVHPDDAATMQVAIGELLAGKRSSGAGRHRLTMADGEVRDVVSRWRVLPDRNGAPRYLYGTLLDVTEALDENDRLSRALDELARAQRLANVGSWRWDGAADRLEWSAQLYRILGYPPSVTPSNEAWLARIHPEDVASRSAPDLGTAQAQDAQQPPSEFRIVRPNGEVRWVSCEAETTRRRDGAPLQSRGVVLDVTERRQLEERLRESLRMEAVGKLAGGVAHDFNNLLTIVQSNVDRLRRGPDATSLERIETAVRTASELTQRLLAFSRQTVLRPRVLDLNRTVSEILELLRNTIPPAIHVEFRPGVGAPAVLLDESQMHQVLMNLITNACDAMPDGGRLTIETRRASLDEAALRPGAQPLPPGQYAALSVRDSGTGMDPSVRDRAFEPFFTTKPSGQGTGLGLATVLGIVVQGGGSVDLDSSIGQGSCFHVHFPAVEQEVTEPRSTPSAPPSSVRVLLVEDNELIREPMTFLLRDAGYEVHVASSAAEARRLWEDQERRFDVLMTDIVMPGDSGTALARELRTERADLRVLFMTGYVDSLVPEPDPRTEILQKPFRLSVPLEALQRLMATA